ncbi:bromo and FHA domain-containing protein DDB_G0267958-like [Leguminivora glycinivorella]|uniref:bromo and FHA domain-containing protein DDB_G0267958-like n=1 Tax=Leguminivora glycinivorella TaxID=1035111 RepID=UPI00200FA1BC|nr:bromo and FHA domain-containing protein DDB_G0267958-like [Leguminivora glycinivorella]
MDYRQDSALSESENHVDDIRRFWYYGNVIGHVLNVRPAFDDAMQLASPIKKGRNPKGPEIVKGGRGKGRGQGNRPPKATKPTKTTTTTTTTRRTKPSKTTKTKRTKATKTTTKSRRTKTKKTKKPTKRPKTTTRSQDIYEPEMPDSAPVYSTECHSQEKEVEETKEEEEEKEEGKEKEEGEEKEEEEENEEEEDDC